MPDTSQPTLRIFVSHSSKDHDFGVQLVNDLRRVLGDDTAVWYDSRGGLNGGDTWWDKIVEQVSARNIFIIVLSPDAIDSKWVRREFNMAFKQDKLIVPLRYRLCNMWQDLDTIQSISFLPPMAYRTAFNELLVALGLPHDVKTEEVWAPLSPDPTALIVQQMTPQIEVAFAEQDWPAIIRRVNLLIKRAPGGVSAAIYRIQAIALREEGDSGLAQEAFDTALALVSDRDQRLTLLRDYAELLTAQSQWNEVLRLAREALRLAPNDARWLSTQQQAQQKIKQQWLEEGNAHQDAGRHQEAIAAYDRAIQLDPNDAPTYNIRGNAYYALKEYQKAVADYSRAIQLDPTDAFVYNNRGLAYDELKEYRKAIADYDRVIQLVPNYASAYNNRGLAYFPLLEFQKAIADYDRAIQLRPNDAFAYSNRANAYLYLDEYQKAIADYDRVIQLHPNDAWAIENRVNAYLYLEEYQKRIARYDRAIQLDPNDSSAYNNRGDEYYRYKKYQKAIADYNRAIQLNPPYANTYYMRGLAYYALKEYQKAIADYDRAIQLNPKYGEAYGERGSTYYALKDYQRAIQDFERSQAFTLGHFRFNDPWEEAKRLLKKR